MTWRECFRGENGLSCKELDDIDASIQKENRVHIATSRENLADIDRFQRWIALYLYNAEIVYRNHDREKEKRSKYKYLSKFGQSCS